MTEVLRYAADAISLGSLYAVFACGLALMLSVARIANFAYGDLMMVGSYALLASGVLPWPAVIVLVLAAAIALNVAIDRIAFRPIRRADGMTLLVVSVGISVLIENVTRAVEGSRSKSVDFGGWFNSPVALGGVSVPRLSILTVIVAAALLGSLTLFLRRSLVGAQLRASSEDFAMSRLLGVRANKTIAIAFAISGAIAGVTAILLTMRSGSLSTDLGLQPTLVAFVAVVLGGMGSLTGATLGGILLGVLSVILGAVLPDGLQPYRDAILFSLVIVILLGRPQGLFGAKAVERV